MTWTIDILSLDGTVVEVADAPFKSARATWAGDGPGALEVNLRPTDVLYGHWKAGQRRLALKDGASARQFQGWLDRLERAGQPSDVQYRAASLGLASILDRRIVHGDVNVVEVVATTAAMTLLDHLSAQLDDATGFTLGTVTGVARSVTRFWCDGDVAAALMKDLAETQDGGFAWEIDADGQFNAWVGGRGTDLSATLTLAPSESIGWTCVNDVAQMATYATGIGDRDDDVPCGPPLAIEDDPLRVDYGRREVVVTHETTDEAEMLGVAQEELRARVASRINLKTEWIEGRGPWGFGDVWIGDVVNAELGPEFGGDADVRCTSVSVTLEPGVHEFVEMEFEAA